MKLLLQHTRSLDRLLEGLLRLQLPQQTTPFPFAKVPRCLALSTLASALKLLHRLDESVDLSVLGWIPTAIGPGMGVGHVPGDGLLDLGESVGPGVHGLGTGVVVHSSQMVGLVNQKLLDMMRLDGPEGIGLKPGCLWVRIVSPVVGVGHELKEVAMVLLVVPNLFNWRC